MNVKESVDNNVPWRTLQEGAWAVLTAVTPNEKSELGLRVQKAWQAGLLCLEHIDAKPLPEPGRPHQPELLDPKQMPKRSLNTLNGRVVLIHAVAHIEFNAINLAWDAVYRFANMPNRYYEDWMSVGVDEARHFDMLQSYLALHGAKYGDYPAHNGLWDMALKTDYDVMVRMALVPRVLEARGLDVTPAMLKKLKGAGDTEAIDRLTVILEEEVGHVHIGTRWFRYCCEQRGVSSLDTFKSILDEHMGCVPPGEMNIQARIVAGFSEDELSYLKSIQRV